MKYTIAFLLSLCCDIIAYAQPLFNKIMATKSGVAFVNEVQETTALNIMTYAYLYNGAGVHIIDYNNDNLMDLYFVSNIGENKLYENKGALQFEDVTAKAGVGARAGYKTGATIVDINNDGYQDIYVCKSLSDIDSERKNLLFINNKSGSFTENAKEFNLDFNGWTYQTYFVDIDQDNDLDCYMLNQLPNPGHTIFKFNKTLNSKGELVPIKYKPVDIYSNQFLENINGKYINKTQSAHLGTTAFSLSALFEDYNNDGLLDIYTCNDFTEPDYLYINKGQNVFKKTIEQHIKHSSLSSMGSDIEDLNNDLLPDMIVLDMLPENNERMKQLRNMNNYDSYYDLEKYGYGHQFAKNVLQKNNGDGSFSDISYYAGIAHTDWSWAPLIADFDNDGLKDVFISNGIMRDLTNQDFVKFQADIFYKMQQTNTMTDQEVINFMSKMPSTKTTNYFYKNIGDFQFANLSIKYGLQEPTWSNGAVYADLDNDGDLDLVINNINDTASIYENKQNEMPQHNYVQIKLTGPSKNNFAIGTECILYSGKHTQRQKLFPNKGFLSTHQAIIHFGLGNTNIVDSVKIIWTDKKVSIVQNPKINAITNAYYNSANEHVFNCSSTSKELLIDVAQQKGLNVVYQENNYIDYKIEPLLPQKYSSLGPCIEVADFNNDGKEDVFIGGASGHPARVFMQNTQTSFTELSQPDFIKDKLYEDGSVLFTDINNDGFKDAIVACGGNDYGPDSSKYPLRIYFNNKKGQFVKHKQLAEAWGSYSSMSLVRIKNEKYVVCWARIVPGSYGKKPQHKSLLFDKNTLKLKNILSADVRNMGMITDAQAQPNGDIFVNGEWEPITKLKIKNDSLDINDIIAFTNGWWNCVKPFDVDSDGDLDLLCGNLGLNSNYKTDSIYPLKMNAMDFDKNGTYDAIISAYKQYNYYPTTIRDYLTDQMPVLRKKFLRYKDFAITPTDEIFEKELFNKSINYWAYNFRSGIYVNNNGKYIFKPFINEAQMFPINDIAIDDFDKDGNVDLLLVGNNYNTEIETGRNDAGKGLLLTGDGKANFSKGEQSVKVDGDIKKIKKITIDKKNYYLIGINAARLKLLTEK